ncbi:MAG: hypothetical protein H6R10_1994 [Rhodocyclaceae bacterium]|nr:hypothetical protein [Rhodocyclaceae bacterium]
MLSRDQIIDAIVSGKLFFAKLPTGGYIARYTRHGLVQRVTDHGLEPLALQGSDLCWQIQAAEESSGH